METRIIEKIEEPVRIEVEDEGLVDLFAKKHFDKLVERSDITSSFRKGCGRDKKSAQENAFKYL